MLVNYIVLLLSHWWAGAGASSSSYNGEGRNSCSMNRWDTVRVGASASRCEQARAGASSSKSSLEGVK